MKNNNERSEGEMRLPSELFEDFSQMADDDDIDGVYARARALFERIIRHCAEPVELPSLLRSLDEIDKLLPRDGLYKILLTLEAIDELHSFEMSWGEDPQPGEESRHA